MKRILLFDSNIEGHHADYLTHLINFWSENNIEGELLVASDERFPEKYKQITASNWAANVRFLPISKADIQEVESLSPIKRSFVEWKLVKKFINIYHPDSVVLMYLDIFQLAISLEQNLPCEVSGIYFRPNFHYEIVGFKNKLNQRLKKEMIRQSMRKSFVKHIFSLDNSAVKVAQKFASGAKMLPISDPVKVYHISEDEKAIARKHYKIDADKKVFLLFGYLDDRKGVLQLLEALEQISEETLANALFLLVGPIAPTFKELVQVKIKTLSPKTNIISHFEEVRGKDIQTLFEVSDYILALYQQHVGMSSIIIRAAVSEKPLLSSDYGFMGKIVKENHLGMLVDSTSSAEIAQAITKIILEGIRFSPENLQKIANENSDIHFAKVIFFS